MIYLILIIAFVLRLTTINQSLWLDEAIGAIATRDLSYTDLIKNFLQVDNHPPFYYLFLKFWSGIFGYSEIALRMPSILFGLGTIYLLYKIATLISSGKEKSFKLVFKSIPLKISLSMPMAASLLLAVSQFHIYYSQEARMYSMEAFFASLLIYFFIRIFQKNRSVSEWIGLSLSILLLGMTDYLPYSLFAAVFMYALFKKEDRKWFGKFALSFLPLFIFWLFWMPTFLKQSQGGAWLMATLPSWKLLAGGANIKQAALVWVKFVIGRITFTNKLIYAGTVLLFSVPYLISLEAVVKKSLKNKIIWIWVLTPLIFSFVTSFFVPSFIYFRFLFIYPAFLLLVVSGIFLLKNEKLGVVVFSLLVLFSLASDIYYYLDKNMKREDWRGAVGYVEENIDAGEIVIFEYPEPFAPYRWYEKFPGRSFGATDSISANKIQTKEKLTNLIDSKTGLYYFNYLQDLSDPQNIVKNTLSEKGFQDVDIINFYGVGQIYHYERVRI